MKKAIICTAILLGILCACSAQQTPPDVNRVSARSKDVPPDLIIQWIDGDETKETTATMSTYSWHYRGGGVEADAPHPLEMTDIATITDSPAKIKLVFDDDPLGYTVHRWAEDAGFEDYDTVATGDDTIVLSDDAKCYVYEVTVEYKNGIVHYAFHICK